MKIIIRTTLIVLTAYTFGCASDHNERAQDRRWTSPILEALDLNHDGIIDSNEIANASTSLLTLDKNHDGKLTYDEIHWPNEREQSGEPEPLIQVLDANHDDVIDAQEIANAPAALLKLDKNHDGRLTSDEYTPITFLGTTSGAIAERKIKPVPPEHARGFRNTPMPAGSPSPPQPTPP